MSRNLEEGEKALPGNTHIYYSHINHEAKGTRAPGFFVLFFIVFSSAFFLLSSPASGQDDSEPREGDTGIFELELPPVIVLGDEITSEREIENPSKFVTVIDTREASERVDTVAGVLSETVGVQVKNWGGMGGFSTVSIRGSSASQVQVFLDGVPLNRAVTGVTNIADLPLDNIEYIEVFRGFTPADFGASGIGGVINLVTRKDLEQRYVTSVSYGYYQTLKANAMAAGPIGPVRLFVFAGYSRSKGDFEYENDNGTPLNNADDSTETRTNNDFESMDLTFRAAYDPGAWELAVVGTGHIKDQGLPGIQSNQAKKTRLETTRSTLTLSARNRMLKGGELDLTLGADGLRDNQLYDDPDGELGAGGSRTNENRMNTAGARVKAAWRPLGESVVVTGYVEYREEYYRPVELEPTHHEGKEQKRTMLATVFQAEATDPTATWTIQATVRQERYWNRIQGDPYFSWSQAAGDNSDSLDLTSPSIGIRLRYSDTLVFKANGGRFYRVPTFYELFGDRGVAIGNTELKPEKGVNFDIGFTYKGVGSGAVSRPYLEYVFFRNRTDDLILFFQNSQRTVRAMNIGRALVGGHELSLGLTLFEDFRVSGNYTFQAAVDQGDVAYWYENALPFRPLHEAFAKVEYSPGGKYKVWTDAAYVSGNYWDRANLYEVPDRHLYNLGATMEVYNKGELTVTTTLEGKNLADDRVSDVAGYPLPGRSAYATVQARW